MNQTFLKISVALSLCATAVCADASSPCESIKKLILPDAVMSASVDVEAGTFAPPGKDKPVDGGPLPAFCRVALMVKPKINIEIWLPKGTWNERYRGEGGGYYVGTINYQAMAKALRAGYAVASTDTGHSYTAEEMADRSTFGAKVGAFGLNSDGSLNHALIDDFAWRSQQQMVVKAKEIIKAYYGRGPKYSYWNGCSSGGREGLVAAQRFPEEYDGILAGCPAINWDRFMPAGLWPQTVMLQEVGRPIDIAKLGAVRKAAIAACDGMDGVTDGIINDPRKCTYNPATSVCRASEGKPGCLTPQEALAIRKIWQGPISEKAGTRLWFGLEPGASFNVIAGPQRGSHPHGAAHFQWVRRDSLFDWRDLTEEDYERDLKLSYESFNPIIGTDQSDLQRFKRRGGKLLIFHGESDEVIFPRGAIHYFDRVIRANGGIKEVSDFARLFMLPGVGHVCSGNNKAPFPKDFFSVLTDWVEKGEAPDRIIATQVLPDGNVRTRPLCAYPRTAKWSGKGSTDEADSFSCVDGEHNPTDFQVVEFH